MVRPLHRADLQNPLQLVLDRLLDTGCGLELRARPDLKPVLVRGSTAFVDDAHTVDSVLRVKRLPHERHEQRPPHLVHLLRGPNVRDAELTSRPVQGVFPRWVHLPSADLLEDAQRLNLMPPLTLVLDRLALAALREDLAVEATRRGGGGGGG